MTVNTLLSIVSITLAGALSGMTLLRLVKRQGFYLPVIVMTVGAWILALATHSKADTTIRIVGAAIMVAGALIEIRDRKTARA